MLSLSASEVIGEAKTGFSVVFVQGSTWSTLNGNSLVGWCYHASDSVPAVWVERRMSTWDEILLAIGCVIIASLWYYSHDNKS